MYAPPKSDLNKYPEVKNRCPKCSTGITMWDYLKPGVRKANRIKCKKCSCTLRYTIRTIESLLFLSLGMLSALVPAYILWPEIDAVLYIIMVLPMLLAIGPIEALYVRKYKNIEIVKDANK